MSLYRWALAVFFVLSIALCAAVFSFSARSPASHSPPNIGLTTDTSAEWVQETTCQQCHAEEYQQWHGSHHQRAMLVPDQESVRGAFTESEFRYENERYEFFQNEEQYFVRIESLSTAQSEVYPIAYTFGWEPLQQYLIETDKGRLQVLGVAWNTEKDQWFHLYEGFNVEDKHPLHWKQQSQNANTQCIECHTTGYQTDYSVKTERFESKWVALGVGCQACHGPASLHVDWAQADVADAPNKGFQRNVTVPGNAVAQLESCAQCHSRRTPLGQVQTNQGFHQNYLFSLLTSDLYEVDGKIKDEVFEYGSFLQSRMYQQGVVCSDCHNPHTAQLKLPGNATCTQCHNPVNALPREGIQRIARSTTNYNATTHHFHQQNSAGAECVNCHMPSKTYMGNDDRHDHSFSVPNPAQALQLGHSDACLTCHSGDPPASIVFAFNQRYPDYQPTDGGYAQTIHAARKGQPGAVDALLQQLGRNDLPPIRYAALLAEAEHYPAPQLYQVGVQSLQHQDPLVRRQALNFSASFLPSDQLQQVLAYLQGDGVRAVRVSAAEHAIEQAQQMGQTAPSNLTNELLTIQQEIVGRPEAHYSLARLYQLQPNMLSATEQQQLVAFNLEHALRLAPNFTAALVASAEITEASSGALGIAELQAHVQQWPDNPDLHFALSLAQIRQGDLAAGINALTRARQLAPENDYYAYVLAIGWHELGDVSKALDILRTQLNRSPRNRQIRLSLIEYLNVHDQAQAQERQLLLEQWQLVNPYDPLLQGYR